MRTGPSVTGCSCARVGFQNKGRLTKLLCRALLCKGRRCSEEHTCRGGWIFIVCHGSLPIDFIGTFYAKYFTYVSHAKNASRGYWTST